MLEKEDREILLLRKIKKDHERKSAQLRRLKSKSKGKISISSLKKALEFEESYEIDWKKYRDWHGFDESYSFDVARKEARIELLQDLISLRGN